MKALMRQSVVLALLALAAASAQAGTVSANDAFTGATVGAFNGSAQAGASFDGSLSDPANVTFFTSGAVGSMGYLSFSTASAITLTGIRLFAASDGEALENRRAMSAFSLRADTDNDGYYETTLVGTAVNPDYGGTQTFTDLASAQGELEAVFMFQNAVTASHFRYEVTQGVLNGPFSGVRIQEIDAITEPAEVPEPASLALLGLGAAAMGLRRRRKSA